MPCLRFPFHTVAAFALLPALLLGTGIGQAQAIETLVKGAAPNLGPLPVPKVAVPQQTPLTARGVIVDQSADNPVNARNDALKQLPKLAFRRLLEQNMTAEQISRFTFPDDKTIAALVQDYEVKTERLSRNRYVASYNVRFSEAVRNYVEITEQLPEPAPENTPETPVTQALSEQKLPESVMKPDIAPPAVSAPPPPTTTLVTPSPAVIADTPAVPSPQAQVVPPSRIVVPAPVAPVEAKRQVLVLPYLETRDGKIILWEDGNIWRETWMKTAAGVDSAAVDFVVPLGDATDVSAGSSDAVWSGDYRTIEKLRAAYRADEVLLPVISRAGGYATIDMYFFEGGRLAGRKVLQPYVGDYTETQSMAAAIEAVTGFMKNRPATVAQKAAAKDDTVAAISRELVGNNAVTSYQPRMSDGIGTVIIAAEKNNAAENPVPAAPAAGVAAAVPAVDPATQALPVVPVLEDIAGPVEINAVMSFSQFSAWSDFQRRLSTLTPPAVMDLSSISSSGAQFRLKYGGSLRTLQQALGGKGIALDPPPVSAAATGIPPVYGVRIVN